MAEVFETDPINQIPLYDICWCVDDRTDPPSEIEGPRRPDFVTIQPPGTGLVTSHYDVPIRNHAEFPTTIDPFNGFEIEPQVIKNNRLLVLYGTYYDGVQGESSQGSTPTGRNRQPFEILARERVIGNDVKGTDTNDPDETGTERNGLSKDAVFFLLKNRRRREVVEHLIAADGDVQFDDLVRAVAAEEMEKGVEELTYKERKSVHTSLYQSHLPKLQEAGVVEYDRRSGSVVATPQVESIRPYLDLENTGAEGTESTDYRSWAGAYVGYFSVLVLIALLEFLSVYRFDSSTISAIALLAGIGFAVLATLWQRGYVPTE
jgi:hypothetical protein